MNTTIDDMQEHIDQLIVKSIQLQTELNRVKSIISWEANEILKLQFGFRIGSVVECKAGKYIVTGIINPDNETDIKPWLVGVENSTDNRLHTITTPWAVVEY